MLFCLESAIWLAKSVQLAKRSSQLVWFPLIPLSASRRTDGARKAGKRNAPIFGIIRSCELLASELCFAMSTRHLCVLLAIALLPSLIWARDAREQARIEFLIRGVETSSRVRFIRNGSEYDGVDGAKHLRMKLAYSGERVKTAEEFVKYCASESSMTHQKYQVRLPDGTTIDAAAYFNAKLREFDEKH